MAAFRLGLILSCLAVFGKFYALIDTDIEEFIGVYNSFYLVNGYGLWGIVFLEVMPVGGFVFLTGFKVKQSQSDNHLLDGWRRWGGGSMNSH